MKAPRLMIVAPHSGTGKTTMTMGILSALRQRGVDTAAFKVGPDYIDPMFHRQVLHDRCINLDPFLLGEVVLKESLSRYAKEMNIIEGVMGYYDGVGTDTTGSSYDVARMTKTPAVLVLRPKGQSVSLAAEVKGFLEFVEDSQIRGVLFTETTPMMATYYAKILDEHLGLKSFGCLPPMEEASLGSRHLGLITADEIGDLQEKIEAVGKAVEEHVNLEGLMRLAEEAPDLEEERSSETPIGEVRLAIARDRAFSFYYDDALALLEELGVELCPFSPLKDEAIPKGCHGVYLGGGYPELYAKTLSEAENFLESLREANEEEMPILAECGGFMTLLESFREEETSYPLAGILPGESHMGKSLRHFGYVHLTAQGENLLCGEGETLKGHEFHYSQSSDEGEVFLAQKPTGNRSWKVGHGSAHLYGGYPHIHLRGEREAATRFVRAMAAWKERHNG